MLGLCLVVLVHSGNAASRFALHVVLKLLYRELIIFISFNIFCDFRLCQQFFTYATNYVNESWICDNPINNVYIFVWVKRRNVSLLTYYFK